MQDVVCFDVILLKLCCVLISGSSQLMIACSYFEVVRGSERFSLAGIYLYIIM